MNGRVAYEETPEGRLAAVAILVAQEFADRYAKTRKGPQVPDVADLRERMKPYMLRELLRVRIDEFERAGQSRNGRRGDLVRQLYECESLLPAEHRL